MFMDSFKRRLTPTTMVNKFGEGGCASGDHYTFQYRSARVVEAGKTLEKTHATSVD